MPQASLRRPNATNPRPTRIVNGPTSGANDPRNLDIPYLSSSETEASETTTNSNSTSTSSPSSNVAPTPPGRTLSRKKPEYQMNPDFVNLLISISIGLLIYAFFEYIFNPIILPNLLEKLDQRIEKIVDMKLAKSNKNFVAESDGNIVEQAEKMTFGWFERCYQWLASQKHWV